MSVVGQSLFDRVSVVGQSLFDMVGVVGQRLSGREEMWV